MFQATVVGKLLYCAPAWSGFCSAADCTRITSFLRRCDKLGYTEKHYVDISTMFQEADDALFRTILSNRSHVLYTYLSERPEIAYALRTRNHNKFLIPKTSDLGDRHFIMRSLYKNLYWCDLTNQTYISISLHMSPEHFIVCICVWTLYTQLRFITGFRE